MLGSVVCDPALLLAPMAGITDSPFRQAVRRAGGCSLVSMEFLSSEAMVRGVRQELAKLSFAEEERPLSMQIYGARPAAMAAAAQMVEEAGADVCDINMGCPARKIVKGAAGAALLGSLDLARKVIAAVRQAITIPLTVKLRSGLTAERLTDLELGRICQEEGVDAVILHPRTAAQQYAGAARWERIAALKQALSLPVIGNGDVKTPADACRMPTETGCDAVMIGRAALLDPFIFRQSAALLAGKEAFEPTPAERLSLMRYHFDLLAETFSDKLLLHKLKTFIGRYSRGLAGGRKLRALLSRCDDPATLRERLETFVAEQLRADA